MLRVRHARKDSKTCLSDHPGKSGSMLFSWQHDSRHSVSLVFLAA